MKRLPTRRSLYAPIALLGAAVVMSFSLVACGSSSNDSRDANGTDRAFAQDMIDHHEMAIDMAEVAQGKATEPEIRQLADDIVATQQREIDQMEAAEKRLGDKNIEAGDLGIPHSMMGMGMNHSEMMDAEDFDLAFIDMMIPHHQGAIRMARVELAEGRDPELRQLAEDIIAAQSKEIREMNEWRKQWYGATSPSGGIPGMDEHMGMDHSMM